MFLTNLMHDDLEIDFITSENLTVSMIAFPLLFLSFLLNVYLENTLWTYLGVTLPVWISLILFLTTQKKKLIPSQKRMKEKWGNLLMYNGKMWRAEDMINALYRSGFPNEVKHFQLLLPQISPDTSGIRGGGNCSIYAFYMGLLAHYGDQFQGMTFNTLIDALITQIGSDANIDDEFIKNEISSELNNMKTENLILP